MVGRKIGQTVVFDRSRSMTEMLLVRVVGMTVGLFVEEGGNVGVVD